MTHKTRESIQPTYDSRETGPRFHVTSDVDGRPVVFQQPIEDPFIRHTIHICWRDLLRGLFRGRLSVTVMVGGDMDVVDDVLELDANTLVSNSTRRREFNASINQALARFSEEPEAASPEES